MELRWLGETRWPAGLMFDQTNVGSLSGLDHDPDSGLWYAISDDRSELQAARFYTLRLTVSAQGLGAPELQSRVTLLNAAGNPYPPRQRERVPQGQQALDVPDPEAIRYLRHRRTVLWTSEGDVRQGLSPALRESSTDGRLLREFALPKMLQVVRGQSEGPRNNLGFEGLAVTPDERHAWAAMEGPLQQDGPVASVHTAGGPCRITRFDVASGQADRQIAYQPDPVPQPAVPPQATAENGVSEVLMDGPHHMLVLERAFMSGVGISARLYRIDTREGSDTLGQRQLKAGEFKPCPKTLVADLGRLGPSRLDNLEGMCWGPTLASGHRTLVFLSDDNFNPSQITQWLAFEVLPRPVSLP